MNSFLSSIFRKRIRSKRIVIVGTQRYFMNAVDFYMFYSRTAHVIERVFLFERPNVPDWWKNPKKKGASRADCYEAIPETLVSIWREESELLEALKRLEPDYICVGNGSDHLSEQLKKNFPFEKLLFSEYGWLPWNQHFYIARGGVARDSDVFQTDRKAIQQTEINQEAIQRIQSSLINEGIAVPDSNFIYIPLQVDHNDFKFNLTKFSNNSEFLEFACDIIPTSIKILAKNHPLNNKPTDLSPFKDRIIDISDRNYSRGQLYQKMTAMFCINSTSLIEAILFETHAFAYGADLYTDKGLLHENVSNSSELLDRLQSSPPKALASRFISLLLERQVNRPKCLSNDLEYIRNHFWNTQL